MAKEPNKRKALEREESLDSSSYRVNLRGDGHAHDDSPLWVRKIKRTNRIPQNPKPMHFTSLHHHSTFSYLDGYALPDAHVRRAMELNMSAIAMTEHGNVSSHVQLEKAAKKYDIKPIFGVELYCGEVGEGATQRKNHLTVLAETQEGYTNLLKLVGDTWSEGFYYEPTASGRMLSAHRDGLVVLSGCSGSLLFTSLVGGKHVAPEDASYARGKRVAHKFKQNLGDAYYLEVQAFPELDGHKRANQMIARISRELKIPMVASMDCHYTVPEESELQAILHTIRPGERRTLEEMERDWGYDVYLCPPVNDATILRKLKETGLTHDEAVRAILTSEEIAQRVNVVIPQLPMVRYPLPPGYSDGVELWREWIAEGWNYRGLDSKLKPSEVREYKERLEREMKVIEDKDFVDYFLIVSDAVRWAKDNGVAVGPARGSAAGSLAVWLLRITEVNPMKFPDLVFERFIDVTRKDLPDIDLDFDSLRRGEVEEYLVAKYGRECVNKVGTFTKFKSKNSLDDVARVFSVPKFRVEEIKDVLIERSSGDLRASATIEDTVDQFDIARKVVEEYPDLALATELEGNYKGFGVHSAGLVVSTGPITNVCAVYERKSKGEMVKVISLDKWDAEAKGLLKLDFLGLSTVTMLNFCREEMGWSLDDLYNLPLEDDRVIAGFKRNDVHGIFQIEGRACRYVNGALQPDDFHEVALVGALGRPGPLHNGAANEYIDIKMGRSQPDYIHDALIPITSHTNGQIVYQEQILRILGEVGGFDWTHRAEVRRIISKKLGDAQINARWTRFKDGAAELHGIDEDTAKRIWGMLITAGSYAFNASHAVAYGMLSWDTMWFKQHEPELFFQSALRITTDGDRTKRLIRDAHKGSRSPLPELAPYDRPKVEVLPPDPVKSGVTWERENGVLLAGFDQIPRVGESMAEQIITHRDENGFNSFDDLLSVKGVGPKTYAVMKEFYESDDPFGALWLDRAIEHVKQEIADENLMLPMPTHVASDLPYVRGEDMEVVWLGTVHTRNVRDLFEWNRARTGEELDRAEVRDPHLNEWCVMVGDDESDQIGLRVDRWRYPKWRNLIWKIRPGKDLILVRGYKPGFLATRQIWISHMWIVDPELDKGVNNGRAPAGPARGRAGSAGARAGRNGSALGRSGRGVGR